MLIAFSAAALPVHAAPCVVLSLPWLCGPALLGQAGETVRDPREQCEELMIRTRKAIAEENFEIADTLLKRAEQLNVRFAPWHKGDTPKRMRRELEHARKAAGSNKPSENNRPRLADSIESPEDEGSPSNEPKPNLPAPGTHPAGGSDDSQLTDPKHTAKSHLLRGRKELGRGNLAAAEHWYRMAASAGGEFGPDEDSPQKLLADIRAAGGGPTPRPVAQAPQSTTDNSRRNSDVAAVPAQEAPLLDPNAIADDEHPLVPSAGKGKPDGRDPFGRRSVNVAPPTDDPSATPEQSMVQDQKPNASHQAAHKLVCEARLALSRGMMGRAQELISEAAKLRTKFPEDEDSPARILESIARYEQLEQAHKQSGMTDELRRGQAEWLLTESQWLARDAAYEDAERLVQQAESLGVDLTGSELEPALIREQIAAGRGTGNATATRSRPANGKSAVQEPEPLPESTGAVEMSPKEQVGQILAEARARLQEGDLDAAEQYVAEAQSFGLPDTAFGPREDRPSWVLLELEKQRKRQSAGRQAQVTGGAGALEAQSQPSEPAHDVTVAYQEEQPLPTEGVDTEIEADAPRPLPAVTEEGPPAEIVAPISGTPVTEMAANSEAMQYFQAGEMALRQDDPQKALMLFRKAEPLRDQLDPIMQQVLSEHLERLSADFQVPQTSSPAQRSALPQVSQEQQVLIRQTQAEVAAKDREAMELMESDPAAALELLAETRTLVESVDLDDRTRDTLMRRVDRSITEVEQYMIDNRAKIELNAKNKATLDKIDRERARKQELDQKLVKLVDEYNKLMDEHRYGEAEVIAKRAIELDPESRLAKQIKWNSTFLRRNHNQNALNDAKENGFIDAMFSVDESSTPFDDRKPFRMPPAKEWKDLADRRKKWLADPRERRSPRELEIEKRLQNPVSVQFENQTLASVVDTLSKMTGINMYLDPTGMAEEGVSSDDTVNLKLTDEISVKSALKVILESMHLDYVIEDEMLKITSAHRRGGKLVPVTYNVADLIIPIPNFVPNTRYGLTGAIHEGYRNIYYGYNSPPVGGAAMALAMNDKPTDGAVNPEVLAQMTGEGRVPNLMAGSGQPFGRGPGGLGGGGAANFDDLIELIQTTIEPDSWGEGGAEGGTIQEYATNLSLVISTTQEIHEQIADLLSQLRRLQDLQVTVEVRFITLNDNFFERIGVDFDFDIDDNIDKPFNVFGKIVPGTDDIPNVNPTRDLKDRDLKRNKGVFVGLEPNGQFRSDLDIPVRQDSFQLAVPQFGGFDPAAGIEMGFAIMSDLEAFFLINAAQGDRRTNVLQAPKVTLFNGQFASVNDTSQTPFVVGVVPVVGDFAAAQQPVIVVLSEGTQLSVQAVVSNDRRFVRLTLLPYFSTIGDVDTFTFTGSTRTTEDSSSAGPEDDTNERAVSTTTLTEGTTVQLPTLASVSVNTTVSVPDGGTVLLGGVKRLSEGRNEFGVPILAKIPYINRLFKNVAIGRDTQSLMMMVTPRIIIQEEEEDLILGNSQTP
jgi:general secretion pathway protein D